MDEIKRLQEERKSSAAPDDSSERVSMGTKAQGFDDEIYGGNDDNQSQYLQSLPTEEEDEENDDKDYHMHPSTRAKIAGAKEILDENLVSTEVG